jgi:hypothetical protein
MAELVRDRDSASFLLGEMTLIGRDASCDLILADPRVSQIHARVLRQGPTWMLEDLASRNGTTRNGAPVQTHQPQQLSVGDTLVFASEKEHWRVAELAPPQLMVRASDGTTLTGGDYLSLPEPESPDATIYRQPTGRWVLERPDGTSTIQDRESVVVRGRVWRVSIPGSSQGTLEDIKRPLSIIDLSIAFTVSSDEEHVELTVHGMRQPIALKARAHNYLLLTLARARLADQARSDISSAEHGWLYQDDLCRMLAMDSSAIYLQIHRARRQLEKAGIAQSADLVERRAGSRQLRLGVAAVTVQRS